MRKAQELKALGVLPWEQDEEDCGRSCHTIEIIQIWKLYSRGSSAWHPSEPTHNHPEGIQNQERMVKCRALYFFFSFPPPTTAHRGRKGSRVEEWALSPSPVHLPQAKSYSGGRQQSLKWIGNLNFTLSRLAQTLKNLRVTGQLRVQPEILLKNRKFKFFKVCLKALVEKIHSIPLRHSIEENLIHEFHQIRKCLHWRMRISGLKLFL